MFRSFFGGSIGATSQQNAENIWNHIQLFCQLQPWSPPFLKWVIVYSDLGNIVKRIISPYFRMGFKRCHTWNMVTSTDLVSPWPSLGFREAEGRQVAQLNKGNASTKRMRFTRCLHPLTTLIFLVCMKSPGIYIYIYQYISIYI